MMNFFEMLWNLVVEVVMGWLQFADVPVHEPNPEV